ncbi:hypothetical protein P280DRAFT_177662 [Massarina eburnea CBS 473.64]|uniref:C2H2-type domain-containing protein n=1 Tax=Massarina eburnea CBS 473.64 TaxID=1395130 RepID=A0A6A6SD88_9PLEO|nr:hypothetical protein P280DRAFT_177662 [Massarina eburnea CBS 473.64]
MPPRNAPLPNAVNVFTCDICDKGYPRQVDFENHLRSYDHTHRQRLADLKKLTASNESESASRPSKGTLDMRSIPMAAAGKNAALGSRFTKVGGPGMAGASGGSRFKKVGVAVGGEAKTAEKKKETIQEEKVGSDMRGDVVSVQPENKETIANEESDEQAQREDEDVVMKDPDEEDIVTWEEYDFTKPTSCDHANCPGCKPVMDGTYEDGWLVVGPA